MQVLPVMQQDAAPTKTEVLSALPGKPATASGLSGLFNGADDLEGVVDFLEELAGLLEQGEQPGLSVGPESDLQENRDLTAQRDALELQQQVLEQELASQPILAERWLQGMQGQQEAVISARAGTVQEHAGMEQKLAAAVEAEPALHLSADSTDLELPARARNVVAGTGDVSSAPPADARLLRTAVADKGAELMARADSMPLLPAADQHGLATAAELEAALTAAKAPRSGGVETAVIAAGGPAQTGANPASEAVIRLQAPEAKWGEQMLHALRQHVEVSLQQGVQQAHIRLDPPELGSLEIHLSHESGRLSVQIGAGQADVARLLQQTSERLRQELMEQNFPQVDVHVFSDSGQQQQQSHQQARRLNDDSPLAAAAQEMANQRHAGAQGQASDVLVTV